MSRFAFFQGEIVPMEQAVVSVSNHTFNYGTGCFGGIRAYWNAEEQELFIFRPKDHFTRFLNSCKLLLINLPYSVEQLVDIAGQLLRREAYREDAYLRPIGYKDVGGIGVKLHDLKGQVTIWTTPIGSYVHNEERTRVMVSSWRRVPDAAIPPRGKIIGAYVNSALAKSEAILSGYDEAICLTDSGHVSEGSAANIFILRGGKWYTPPVTDDVLEGITRSTVMQLLRDVLGFEVMERSLDRSELYLADEIFFCGTGVQVASITEVDRRPVGDGNMGKVTNQLRDLYFRVVRGREPKYRSWCLPVYAGMRA
ncbi:MAG: branched-chain amino acid transaminase [Deinococcus sp.]|nr:branched-chain amino acid transaminase [Deinococcus sp.]